MDLKSLLDYQKKDAELIKLEKQLSNNENKKIFSHLCSLARTYNTIAYIINYPACLSISCGKIAPKREYLPRYIPFYKNILQIKANFE